MVIDEFVEMIIDKKELRGINKELAKEITQQWLSENPEIKEAYLQDPEKFPRTKEYNQLRSDVREQLRKIYGVFFTSKYNAKKEGYVQELIKADNEQTRQDLLKLHRSSAERLATYPLLYQQLFAITNQPTSILDLGCGFNPFAYPYLGCKPSYHCADIACEDLKLIKQYLDSQNINNSIHCIDLSKPENIKQLPKADIAFAFKLFDSLEDREFNITEQILEAIPADILIASFPTKSIGQKKTIGDRVWFEKLITGKELARVTLSNEQFYVITLTGKERVTHQ